MARIPTVINQVSARAGRTTQNVPSPRASAEAYGASEARGLQTIGAGLDKVAQGLYVQKERKRQEDVANAVAQSDFTSRELEIRNQVGPDAAGYQERVVEEYDTWVEEQAESLKDSRSRELFKQRMRSNRPSLSSRSAQYEAGTAATHSRNQANASLVSIDNKIRLDAGEYDNFVEQGLAVIDARGDITATQRADMKEKWREDAALSRFEGMLEAANTVEDVEVIQAELRGDDGRDWSAELSQAGLERVLGMANSAGRAIQTRADSQARAAVRALEDRGADIGVLIPEEELASAQVLVDASNNLVLANQLARINRDQQLVKQYHNASPAEINAAANALPSAEGDAPPNFDWSRYAIEGATRPDSFSSMTPGMRGALAAMMTAADEELGGGLQVYSGYRSYERQAELYDTALRRYGSEQEARKWVAPPGNSRHNTGQAADLKWNGVRLDQAPERVRNWVKNNAQRFGLEVPMEWEPWQVEEAGARGQPIGTPTLTQTQYEDKKTLEAIGEHTQRSIDTDPMSHAASVGLVTLGDVFSENGMAERGQHAAAAMSAYSIPAQDMQPFTKQEEQVLTNMLNSDNDEDILRVVTSIPKLGNMAHAGAEQLGGIELVYGHAAGLINQTGQSQVATDIVRGRRRLSQNPDIKNLIGASDSEMGQAFFEVTQGALMGAEPAQRQAIRDAAVAHYVQTYVAAGGNGNFDKRVFERSVQSVLGGTQEEVSVGKVNGTITIMPPGVSPRQMNKAINNMVINDWVFMSEQGMPPLYADGSPADPDDLATEAQLEAIGGNRYRIMTDDNQYLITGLATTEGQAEAYIFAPTPEAIKKVAEMPTETRASRDAEAENLESTE